MGRRFRGWLAQHPPPPANATLARRDELNNMRWASLSSAAANGGDSDSVGDDFRFAWVLLLDDPSSPFWLQ